jgi:hypothetical protein
MAKSVNAIAEVVDKVDVDYQLKGLSFVLDRLSQTGCFLDKHLKSLVKSS